VALLLSFEAAFAIDFPYSEWNLANYNGAYAIFNNGFVAVANGGSDYWHVQLTRSNIELQAGKTYEVKFYLQGVSARRYVEVRIGRDGFPYDAFAEFGEVVATVNGRTVTKTFTMQSGNVSNARFEFNLGKYSGTVYLSDVSLNCLDCGSSQNATGNNSYATSASDWGYVVVADMVDFRDNSMSLGDVFGQNLELGVDSKIYGNVDASNHCFLRERANISGDLRYTSQCEEQNGVGAKTKSKATLSKPVVDIPNIVAGITPISVGLDQNITVSPNKYGTFYANARSKIHLSSGSYTFQNIFTEPDAEFTFDLTSGPITVNVLGNVRFGDRNTFSITGGNPSEILWNVAGENVDMGTDGLYFGKFVAPSAFVRIPSRSHLVGAVYANKFQIEPQSTVSQEPRATEISHSEEHFGPFFEPGVFRYVSQLPLSASAIEMFVYADNAQVKINDGTSPVVELPSSNGTVNIRLKQKQISGFPAQAFGCNYVFSFKKNANYRIYWNPQTQCKQGCDGTTAATAVGDFATVLETAKSTGREINMVGGIWDVTQNYTDGIVPWNVGFELVGYTGNIWDLSSASSMPTIFLGETSHIQIYGKSPRSLTGFWIGNGYNKNRGGAIASESQHITLRNMLLSAHKSDTDGGALFAADTLDMYNVHFKNSLSKGNGGAIYTEGLIRMQNVIFDKNIAAGNGGASYSSDNAFVQNAIFSQNESNGEGGAWFAQNGSIKVSNATIFDNNGKQGFSAVGGNATGQIYNSILWKNIKSSCSLEKCKKEVSPSLSVHHSITETIYNGIGNLVNDPKFLNESKPAGDNEYMSMIAGLTLQNESPAIGVGVKDDFVLETDIMNIVRSERIDLGAYAWYDLNADLELGEFTYGSFKKKEPAYPIFETLGNEYDILAVGNSPKGRVMRKKMPKSQVKNVKRATIEYTLLDEYGNPYPNMEKQKVVFYKAGEENEKVIFQTLVLDPSNKDYNPDKHGRLLVFTFATRKAGIYKNVQVFPIIGIADKLYGEVIDWE
jgi:predicted outer membrane repeat protein